MAKTLDPKEYSKRLHAHSKKGRQAFRKKFDPKPKGGKGGKPKKASDPFAAQVRSATELEFGDTERELQSQGRAEGFRTQQTGDWYNDFLAKTTAMKTEQANRDAQLQQQVQNQAQQAQTTDQAGRQKVQEEAQADAAKRGAALNPQQSVDEQNAIASRRSSADNYNNLIGTLSRNQQTYLGGQEGVVKQAGIEAKQRQQGRERKIADKLTGLAREKGAFRNKYLQQIQDDLSKRAAEAALTGQKAESLRLQKQNQQFQQTMAQMKFGQDASQFAVTAGIQQQNADSQRISATKPSGKSGESKSGPTQSQRATNQDTWDQVYEYVRKHPKRKGISQGKPGSLTEPGSKGDPTFIKNNPRYFAVARHVLGHKGKAKNPGDKKFLRRKGIKL